MPKIMNEAKANTIMFKKILAVYQASSLLASSQVMGEDRDKSGRKGSPHQQLIHQVRYGKGGEKHVCNACPTEDFCDGPFPHKSENTAEQK